MKNTLKIMKPTSIILTFMMAYYAIWNSTPSNSKQWYFTVVISLMATVLINIQSTKRY